MRLRNPLRILFAACVLFGLHGMPAAAQQQQPAKATLQGVVRHARTGEPIAGAQVTVADPTARTPAQIQRAQPLAMTTSNGNGEFVLEVDAVAQTFTVLNNGFVRYDSPKMALTPGQTLKDLAVRMIPTAAVSGRVGSATGKPLGGIRISLLRPVYSTNGTMTFSTSTTVQTNDLGEYRAYWVTPGRYYVTASGRGEGAISFGGEFESAVQRGTNEVPQNYSQLFFPGVADASRASMIDLTEGGELRGIDFTLPSQQQLYSIRGRVLDITTGQAPANASITLSERTAAGGGGSSSAVRWYDPATGTFELPNLKPGRYGITAQLGTGFSLTGPAAGAPSASLSVTIEDSNIENLTLTIRQQPVISGQIRVEGQLPAATPMERLRVSLTAAGTASPAPFPVNLAATAAADGTFKMNAAPEGEFRVAMTNLPTGFYLKEARLNGADVLSTPSGFSAAGRLEVVVSANAGQVSGRILNEQMNPVAGIEAVLIPTTARNRPELFKRATTDPEGRFTIAGIAPGDYKLFAWERLAANSFFDPAVMAEFEQRGTPVRIAESSRETVDVKLIPEGSVP